MGAAVTDTRPFSAFEWMLARRYLRARRKEGFISVIAGFSFLGIVLGVATLIIVMAVMNGFRQELFKKILGLDGHVLVYKVGGDFSDYQQAAAGLKKVPGVTQALPLIEGQVIASTAAQALGAKVRGVSEESLKALHLISGNIRFGTLDGFDTAGGVAVGTRLANALRVTIGDSITLISPRGASTPFGTAPRIKPYKIVALFEMGMAEFDRSIMFMPLSEAQRFFNRGASVDVLEVMVEDPQNVQETRAAMLEEARPTHNFSYGNQSNRRYVNEREV
jgi:lipoprotein-releasing system permease protein